MIQKNVAELAEQKDAAYAERNMLVAALARCALNLGGDAWLALHDPADTTWESDWRTIVFVEFPETGQMSWHIHDSEKPIFEKICRSNGDAWDGRTTEEKYARLAKIEHKSRLQRGYAQ